MHYCGDFRDLYEKDMEISRLRSPRLACRIPGVPLRVALLIRRASLDHDAGHHRRGRAVGLNILTGFTGQISLGRAPSGVGAYTSATSRQAGASLLDRRPGGGLRHGCGRDDLRHPVAPAERSLLAIATLASQFILEWVFCAGTGDRGILRHRRAPALIGGYVFESDRSYYYVVLVIAILMVLFAVNLVRTRTGRAFMSVRTITSRRRSWGSTCSSTGSSLRRLLVLRGGRGRALRPLPEVCLFGAVRDRGLGYYLAMIIIGGMEHTRIDLGASS